MNRTLTLMYFTSVFIYGTIGYFLHFINASSEFVVFCRGLIGSLFILLVLLFRKKKIDFANIKKNLGLLILSGISLGLNWVFLFAGYRYSVSLASLCNYVAPIIVVLISIIISKEKISMAQITCIVLSFIGIMCISGVFENRVVSYKAIIYGLLAAIGFVVLVLCNRKCSGVDSLEKTYIQLFVSALTVLPFVVINKSFPLSLDTRSLLFIIMLGVLHTGVAYILYFGSIDRLSPIKIALIGYVEPALSVITGALLLSEPMNILTIVGAILIIGSALCSEILKIKK